MRRIIVLLVGVQLFKVEAQSSTLAIADSLYATRNYIKAINYYPKEGSRKGRDTLSKD